MHVWAKLARVPGFSALTDPLADVHGELPQVPRDLRPVAGELRPVLVSFFDDVGRILEVRLPNQGRASVEPGSHDDQRDDAAPVPETLERNAAVGPEELTRRRVTRGGFGSEVFAHKGKSVSPIEEASRRREGGPGGFEDLRDLVDPAGSGLEIPGLAD